MRSLPVRISGHTPASRPAPFRRPLGAALLVGLLCIAACATAPPPQVTAAKGAPLGSEATGPYEAGHADGVIDLTEQVRTVTMANGVGASAATWELIPPGHGDAAEAVLAGFGEGADALLLSGLVAEDGRDWELAMNRYEALPVDYPQRSSSLLRARFEWRSSNLPPCAQEALASPRLTRSELAILLVSLAPQLAAVGSGASAVLSDIVDEPCYLGVLTAVRSNLLAVDRLEHRFFPARATRPAEVRSAVESLCHVLGLQPPVWCQGAEATADCTLISAPVRGQQVAELVSRLTDQDEP